LLILKSHGSAREANRVIEQGGVHVWVADRGGFELALSLQTGRRGTIARVGIKEAMSVANRRGNGRPTRGRGVQIPSTVRTGL
jgi:hypothetical protein